MVAVFEHPDFEHETVAFREDAQSGLRAIIAIHNTNLGPAIGGCRILAYENDAAAIKDVLRLSKGMTYKCAIGGIPFGGGKAVIIADPKRDKTPALLHAMGRFVDRLGGEYITSFDAGTTLEDVATMGEVTPHVGGITPGAGNASQSTAQGVFNCMERAVKLRLSKANLEELIIAIQGAGNVGSRLARMAADQGANIFISDVNDTAARQVATDTHAEVVAPEAILSIPADVFAPCAYGGILNDQSIPAITAKIVCGGANNQLDRPENADQLKARGILYCPDYLANAGGIIDLHYQINGLDRAGLAQHLRGLADTFEKCLAHADAHGVNMANAADLVAHQRIWPGSH